MIHPLSKYEVLPDKQLHICGSKRALKENECPYQMVVIFAAAHYMSRSDSKYLPILRIHHLSCIIVTVYCLLHCLVVPASFQIGELSGFGSTSSALTLRSSTLLTRYKFSPSNILIRQNCHQDNLLQPLCAAK